MNGKQLSAQVVVVGGGPAGLTAALALASAGLDTVLVARQAPEDHRTTALLASSVTALDTLSVWAGCHGEAAPLRCLRIVDATARLWRAPEARFEAEEIGLEAFAWNIENRHLVAALESRAAAAPHLRRIEADAVDIASDGGAVRVRAADGSEITARLAVGADGRNSICRAAAGITMRRSRYPQTALIYNVGHSRPHRDVSTEFHTEAGPFTLVPLPGLRSSIVCVVDPDDADDMQKLSDTALARELERRAHSILGRFSVEPGRGVFPLVVEVAQCFAAGRIALVGEAAHRFPPIGAQGLNLSLRDAATIAEIAAGRREDPGAPAAMHRYESLRRADVASRMLAVDLLNRSLLSTLLPVQGLRGIGMYLLDSIGPLRRAVMREGVTPSASQPRLMRGEALG